MAALLNEFAAEMSRQFSASPSQARAPLEGLKVVEFAGLAPGPFAGLVLADYGASVTRIDRADTPASADILCRHKRSLAVDFKTEAGRALLRRLISQADVVIDPFRPGVLERLGLGPDVFLVDGGLNERLVYARLVGFPRDGPYKDMAGHDINYLALSGVLSMLPGPSSAPAPPLNLIADFAGGGLACALGILIALVARGATGKGQVVNADMVSGTRYLASFPLLFSALAPGNRVFGDGDAPAQRGRSLLTGGAPHYGVYACKPTPEASRSGRAGNEDTANVNGNGSGSGKGKSKEGWMSVGCLEPQFYTTFMERFAQALPRDFLDEWGAWRPSAETRSDERAWPRVREFLTRGFRTRTRDEWAKVFFGTDACCVPVLFPSEASKLADASLPQPHPSLSATASLPTPSTNSGMRASVNLKPGEHNEEILLELGFSSAERAGLAEAGAFGKRPKARL